MRIDVKVPYKPKNISYIQDVKITLALRFSTIATPEEITRRILSEKHPEIQFANVDFNNLKQDAFSSSHNDIIGSFHIIKGKQYRRYYVKKCDECAKNTAVHGLGYTIALKANIDKGKLSCGCSTSTRYTEYQTTIRLNNNLKSSMLLGWVGEYKDVNSTKYRAVCLTHNYYNNGTTFIVTSMNRESHCCMKQARISTSNLNMVDDDIHIADIMKTKKFKEGTIFKRSNIKQKWESWCPVCSIDEFVQNGLCTGWFIANLQDYKRGQVPCRCSKLPGAYTKEQNEYRVKKRLVEIQKEKNFTFIGFEDDNLFGDGSYLWYNCSEHGAQRVLLGHLMSNTSPTSCNGCAKYGFNKHADASFYIHEDGNGNEKGGVTNRSVSIRLAEQNKSFQKYSGKIETWKNHFHLYFPDTNNGGVLASNLEKMVQEVISNSGCAYPYTSGDGYTETFKSNNEVYNLIIKFYNNHKSDIVIIKDTYNILGK